MVKKAIITVGISASGKTTWANEFVAKNKNWIVITRDDIRKEYLATQLGRKLNPGELWEKWKFKWEPEVTKYVDLYLARASEEGLNVIIADTNLNAKHRSALMEKLKNFGYEEIELMTFDVSFEEACLRDARRVDGVGHSVLMRQWLQYQDFKNFGKKYIPNPNLRKAIMIDLDGTLCLMRNRGPFEWNKVNQDEVNPVVYHVLRGYYQQGYEVILMSGRDSICRELTEKWLQDNKVSYTELFMRAKNDNRKDAVVKKELFWKHVAHKYCVEVVIDDRPQVVREWIAMGLSTLIVGNPWIEF